MAFVTNIRYAATESYSRSGGKSDKGDDKLTDHHFPFLVRRFLGRSFTNDIRSLRWCATYSHANYALTDEIWPKSWFPDQPTIWRIYFELNSCRDTIQVSYSIPAVKFILVFEQTLVFNSRSPPAATRSWPIHLQPDISSPEVFSGLFSLSKPGSILQSHLE